MPSSAASAVWWLLPNLSDQLEEPWQGASPDKARPLRFLMATLPKPLTV
jgi:hypothetical protein